MTTSWSRVRRNPDCGITEDILRVVQSIEADIQGGAGGQATLSGLSSLSDILARIESTTNGISTNVSGISTNVSGISSHTNYLSMYAANEAARNANDCNYIYAYGYATLSSKINTTSQQSDPNAFGEVMYIDSVSAASNTVLSVTYIETDGTSVTEDVNPTDTTIIFRLPNSIGLQSACYNSIQIAILVGGENFGNPVYFAGTIRAIVSDLKEVNKDGGTSSPYNSYQYTINIPAGFYYSNGGNMSRYSNEAAQLMFCADLESCIYDGTCSTNNNNIGININAPITITVTEPKDGFVNGYTTTIKYGDGDNIADNTTNNRIGINAVIYNNDVTGPVSEITGINVVTNIDSTSVGNTIQRVLNTTTQDLTIITNNNESANYTGYTLDSANSNYVIFDNANTPTTTQLTEGTNITITPNYKVFDDNSSPVVGYRFNITNIQLNNTNKYLMVTINMKPPASP